LNTKTLQVAPIPVTPKLQLRDTLTRLKLY